MSNHVKPARWHRAGSVIGLIALVATPAYFWFDGLSQYATGRSLRQTAVSTYDSLHEAAIHTSDTVSLSHLVIFTLSLIVARSLYAAIDPEQWRRDKKRLRLAYEFVRPTSLSDEDDLALSQRRATDFARYRPGGI